MELENQKIPECIRREEESKRQLSRLYDLERENIQLGQALREKEERIAGQQNKALWEKSSSEEGLRNLIAKLEKSSSGLQTDLDKLNSKMKELNNTLMEREADLEKCDMTIASLTQSHTK